MKYLKNEYKKKKMSEKAKSNKIALATIQKHNFGPKQPGPNPLCKDQYNGLNCFNEFI